MQSTKLLFVGALALLLGGAAVGQAHDMKAMDGKDMKGMKAMDMDHDDDADAKDAKTVTLSGEILDMDCYMNEGAHGKDHASCAVMCLNEGAPVGLLADDGKAYFLTANEGKGMLKHYQDVRGWGGARAEITGVLQTRNGLSSLRIDDAKKLK